jgi:hypothetical protein
MAKFIVNTTIQTLDKAGKKLVIERSAEPQDIPAGLVKELLARGTIEEPKGTGTNKKSAPVAASVADDGSGDDGSGD